MKTIEKILKIASKNKELTSSQLAKTLGLSRQAIANYLKRLVEAGVLVKTGSTHNARYLFTNRAKPPAATLKLNKKIKGLQEDVVFDEVSQRLNLKKVLNKNVYQIALYSFSEMLNNAIDHSASEFVSIEAKIAKGVFSFVIRDKGIGAYTNVKKGFHLKDEYEAAEHVFKGKQTTVPSRHSGQGIFFTSRIADRFELRSHRLVVIIDNNQDDVFFADTRPLIGTEVKFQIRQRSKKRIDELFQRFANENFDFDKNEVRVRLSLYRDLMSRSQARRLLAGLDKYQRIVFDFQGVEGIGQAFTDEIFRVFPLHHPGIQVSHLNASSAIEFMIKRATLQPI